MEGMEFLEHFAKSAAPLQKELLNDLKEEAELISPTRASPSRLRLDADRLRRAESRRPKAPTGRVSEEMVEILADFARRGKWIRGALVVLGYRCAGQEENEEVVKAGVAIDIIQSAILIADDVMDRGDVRRGKPTVHKIYERLAAKYNQKDAAYFGIGMAVNLSLAALIFAEHIFASVELEKDKVSTAQSFMNRYLVDAAFGQGMDLAFQKNSAVMKDDVLKIHKLKTAYYTIAGPLQVGAILGGATEEQLQAMEKYGLKVGAAFQLRDDELGLFGEKRKIGKSVDSDLKEGKNTILFVKAFEKANSQQHKVLERAFGNPDVTTDQLQAVREIVVKTGALRFSQDICSKLLKEGKSYIPQISDDRKLQETLYNLAGFMVKREK